MISIYQLFIVYNYYCMNIQSQKKQIAEVINNYVKKKGKPHHFSSQSPSNMIYYQNFQLNKLPILPNHKHNGNKRSKNKEGSSFGQNKYVPLPFDPLNWFSDRQISLTSRLFSCQKFKDEEDSKEQISLKTTNLNETALSQPQSVNSQNETQKNIQKSSVRNPIRQSFRFQNKESKQIKLSSFQKQRGPINNRQKIIKQWRAGIKSGSKTKNNFFLKFYKNKITIQAGCIEKIKGIREHFRDSSLNSQRKLYNTFYQ